MNSATFIFPHQLFENHPGIAAGRSIYLAQDPLFFGNDRRYPVAFHQQKLVLHRASMHAYTDELRGLGHHVHSVPHTSDYREVLPKTLTELHLADPHDFILEKRLRRFAEKRGIALHIHPTPAFLSPTDEVMVPNVFGMSQFADGGTFTTKPYISGSNYVLKMSDEKKGPWTTTWDALFWTFVGDHQDLFLKNPRTSMMARNWHKFPPEKQNTLHVAANQFLESL